jgi:hypothetical protein
MDNKLKNTRELKALQAALAAEINDPVGEDYTVLLRKNPTFMPRDWSEFSSDQLPDVIKWDYAKVLTFKAVGLDAVFAHMQGERYSPNGEARPLILFLGLNHTSCSIGDLILRESDGTVFEVDFTGFITVYQPDPACEKPRRAQQATAFKKVYWSAKTNGDLDKALKALDGDYKKEVLQALLVVQDFCGITMRDEHLIGILQAEEKFKNGSQ